MDTSNVFEDIVVESLTLLTPLKDILPNWYASLQALAHGGSDERLRIGVVGVTSSGKSTFINALLGEELLPEQSKATTNVPVVCRRGPHRKLIVTLRSDSVVEYLNEEVNCGLLKYLCSEDGNKDNWQDIRHLSLFLPNCCIEPALEIIDTPGMDAFGGEKHEEITLYECVPSLDIVIYMTHLVRPFAASDIKLLKRVLEHDQRVLFAISHSDVEKDDYEKNELSRSKEQKLKNHITELEKKLKYFPELSRAEVVTISSRLGKLAQGDHSSDLWRESNIGSVLKSLERFRVGLNDSVQQARSKRLRKILTQLVAAIGDQTPNLDNKVKQAVEEEASLAGDVKGLQTARDSVMAHLLDLQIVSASVIDEELATSELHSLLSHLSSTDISGFRSALSNAQLKWSARQAKTISAIDNARALCRGELDKLGLSSGRTAVKHKLDTEEFPSLERRIQVKSETYTVRVRRGGWGTVLDWFDGGKEESHTTTTRSVSISLIKQDLRDFLQASITSLSAFIESQVEMFRELYLKPIEIQFQEQMALLSNRNHLRNAAEAQKTQLPRLLDRLLELAVILQLRTHEPNPSPTPEATVESYNAPIIDLSERPHSAGDLGRRRVSSMLARIREGIALNRFWRVAVRAAGGNLPNRLLIAGMSTEDAERFTGYLVRSHHPGGPIWLMNPEGVGEITVSHALGDTHIIVVPSDVPVSSAVVREQCILASAIAVPFDGAQPSAGLNRLLAQQHYALLSDFAKKAFLIFPGAATYDHRLSDLVTEAIAMARSTAFSSVPWYVFESGRYDARYTDFIEIVRNVLDRDGTEREVLREWNARELSQRPPFSGGELRRFYDEIRDREMADGK